MPSELDLSLETNGKEAGLPLDTVPLGSNAHGGLKEERYVKMALKVFVSIAGSSESRRSINPKTITNICISLNAPGFIHTFPSSVLIEKMSTSSTTPLVVNLSCYATRSCLPISLDATLQASYTCSTGESKLSTHSISLPLALACRLRSIDKSSPFKITLDTSHEALPLTELFDDFLLASQSSGVDVGDTLGKAAAQAMGFYFYFDGSSASILVSKQAGRYRIQGDTIQSLVLITNVLEKRLRKHIGEALKTQTPNGNLLSSVITYAETIPLSELFLVIAQHFNVRVEINNLLAQLNDAAHQFRMYMH